MVNGQLSMVSHQWIQLIFIPTSSTALWYNMSRVNDLSIENTGLFQKGIMPNLIYIRLWTMKSMTVIFKEGCDSWCLSINHYSCEFDFMRKKPFLISPARMFANALKFIFFSKPYHKLESFVINKTYIIINIKLKFCSETGDWWHIRFIDWS